jgi:hypothetical protein
VGLVKYGARAVSEASIITGLASVAPPPRSRSQSQSHIDEIELRKSGFWEWIKAAF